MSTKLPIFVKLGYGTADFGIYALETLLRLHLLFYYTDQVHLRPHWAAVAISLAIVWDAITDPLVGTISDYTNTKHGKRRPYIIVGSFLLPVFIVLIFAADPQWSQITKLLYLLCMYICLNTCTTLISIPHSALGGEITDDRDERTALYALRFLFANFGALFAAAIPTSIYVAIAVFITAQLSFWATKGYDKPFHHDDAPLKWKISWRKLRNIVVSIWENRIFVLLFFSYVIANIGLAINSTIALYYYKYRLLFTETQTNIVILTFLLVISVSIAGWVTVSRKFGKKMPAFFGIGALGIMTVIVYPLFPEKNIIPPLCAAFFGGIMVGATALLESLVADSVDYDELKTGEHREGLYFGIWRMGAKISRALSMVICGTWLSYIGFVPNTQQTSEISSDIAWMFGPGVGAFLILSSVIFWYIPYSDEEHKQVQRKLRENKI